MSNVSFGLDVGHSTACLAVSKDGRVDVVANPAGDRCTDAVVAWNGDEVLVGSSAAGYGARNPLHCVRHNLTALRLSLDANGKNKEAVEGLLDASGPPNSPKMFVSNDGRMVYHIDGAPGSGQPTKKVPPASVQSHVFKYMYDIACSHGTESEGGGGGGEVSEGHSTVLSVPYEFTPSEREAVAKTARQAGFNVVQVVSQPAAAALAYGLGQIDNSDCFKCLVYRCGGHTLTVSVVQVSGGMIRVLKCNQYTQGTGGDKVTAVLADFLAAEFQRKYKLDPRESKRSRMKLKLQAETVKRVLSTLDTANCYIESLCEGIDLNCNVTRARFDNELGKILPGFVDPVNQTLTEAGVKPSNIDKVILCGGTSKIPKLKSSVSGLFTAHNSSVEILSSLSPDEVLAMGAAAQASLLTEPVRMAKDGDEELVSPRLHATSGALVFLTSLTEEEVTLVPSETPIPTRKSHHMNIPKDTSKISVKLFFKDAESGALQELGEMSLEELTEESKLSISAHIHRDGGVHFGLTDKTTSRSDQLTFTAPQV